MEGGIGHDDKVIAGQAWTKHGLQPEAKNYRIAGAFEQQGLLKIFIDAGRDQGRPWPPFPADKAVTALALQSIAVAACHGRLEAAFIDIDRALAAAKPSLTQAQKSSS